MRLNLIGKGKGWKAAPCVDSKYDTWGVTSVLLSRPVDLVIDMHFYDRISDIKTKADNRKVRDICTDKNIRYIGPENYPLKEIVSAFKTDYFSCTVDYAIALAIYRGYTEINLYGVNMAKGSEYAYEKPGVDFWCGFAMGRGITVNVHGKASMIMRTRDNLLYGYGTERTV